MSETLDNFAPKIGVWLINLPRSEDRRLRMEAQLQALGLDYQLFVAIDGRSDWDKVSKQIDMPTFEKNVGRAVMPGEVGCYLSHISVWRAFLDSEEDVALILEDDVILHDDFLVALQEAVANTDRWDMLKLNRIRAKFPVRQSTIGAYHLDAFIGTFTGMGAYLVTKPCVMRLLADMLPIRRPIDHHLDRVNLRYFRHFAIQPFPSHVDDKGTSTITGTGFNQVRKFPIYQRIGVYRNRGTALVKKGAHLLLGKAGIFKSGNAR